MKENNYEKYKVKYRQGVIQSNKVGKTKRVKKMENAKNEKKKKKE